MKLRYLIAFVATALAASLSAANAQTPLRFSAEYTLSVVGDSNRKSEAATSVKAIKGGISLIGGGIEAGTLIDEVEFGPTRYRINTHSDASALLTTLTSAASIDRSSEGRTGGGYLMTDRFTEKRGKKDPLIVVTDYGRKLATYFRGKEQHKQEPIQYRLADSASLPYVFFRQPMGKAAVTIAATDGLSTRMLILDPKDDTVTVDGKVIPAIRWTRRIVIPNDPSLDLWVRKEDGFPLHIRLGLNAKYGLVLDQRLKRLPTLAN